ncbi:putative membrane protein [Propionispora sp. 2/2-37]|uniref:FtsW/RodA/SpoVE family cell cycle protein n=1 Tax=Propionispora sp. 2/2-37 TaxID=1677858 RepID=UPI0006BB854C|nr:putative peptidoglycan glycosyltransferase FtsW [Propionispora sp. 2/2-37]CUH97589.1 putative membrane protein [Propionispora sp. 2/2-37]
MVKLPKIWTGPAEAVLFITLILFMIGTVNVFSASFVLAGQLLDDSYFFLKRHLISFAIGFVVLLAALGPDYRKLNRLAGLMVVMTLGLLAAVHFAGVDANGARRWLDLGIKFQPSEIAKLTSIIAAASYLGPHIDKQRKISLVSFPVILAVIMGILILKQPDMGTAVIVVGLCLILYLLAGLPRQQRYTLYACGAVFLVYFSYAASYRADRIIAWLDPWEYQQGIGYQTVQALLAIGSGGMAGTGLGMGASKFYYLPESHTDFAFAVLCQEMGFIGAFMVLTLIGLLACYGGQIARQAKDGFGKMLAIGITLLVAGQAVVNIAMVSGLLPVVGVPLPFISFGGTSLIVNMAAIGILINIGRKTAALTSHPEAEPDPLPETKKRLKLIQRIKDN